MKNWNYRHQGMNGTATITSNPVFFHNKMTVNLTGVADVQTITLMLSSVTDSFRQVLPDKAISIAMVVSDTNGHGTVNASDVGQTKGQVGVSVSSSNYRTDINASGAITLSDVALARRTRATGWQLREQLAVNDTAEFKLESRQQAEMWLGGESNSRHEDFQSSALPTELPSRDGSLCKLSLRRQAMVGR